MDSQVVEVDTGQDLVVALEANMVVAVLKRTTYFLLEKRKSIQTKQTVVQFLGAHFILFFSVKQIFIDKLLFIQPPHKVKAR